MLRSLKKLCGDKLGASDGEIGHVKDFYFDDSSWAVRFAIADTGSWLPGRKVLISPHAFGTLHQVDKLLLVNLTRKQIEDSPSIESRKPVSRQYEEECYRYYGWPYYWQGDALWGMTAFPIWDPTTTVPPGESSLATAPQTECADPHLRSMQAVDGYRIQATDGIVGHVCDFLMDAQSWAISQFVIKTGHRLSGKEVQVPTSTVQRISYEDSLIIVDMTREAIEQSPTSILELIGATT